MESVRPARAPQVRHRARPGGRSPRHVAEVGDEWVALIAVGGAAPHTRARERKIGRTPRQRARRLHLGATKAGAWL